MQPSNYNKLVTVVSLSSSATSHAESLPHWMLVKIFDVVVLVTREDFRLLFLTTFEACY